MASHGDGRSLRSWCLAVMLAVAMSTAALSPAEVCEADLLFVVTDSGNAITEVTQGIGALPIDHVAIAHRIGGNNGPLYVIEATPRDGVTLTPIDSLMARVDGKGSVVVGRVNREFDTAGSVRRALSYVGRPYDVYFMSDDSAIYCSELVQLCYRTTNSESVFPTIAMSFHDSSGRITPFWRQHYAAQGLDVPEGAPGTNPGQLSRNEAVTILDGRLLMVVSRP